MEFLTVILPYTFFNNNHIQTKTYVYKIIILVHKSVKLKYIILATSIDNHNDTEDRLRT